MGGILTNRYFLKVSLGKKSSIRVEEFHYRSFIWDPWISWYFHKISTKLAKIASNHRIQSLIIILSMLTASSNHFSCRHQFSCGGIDMVCSFWRHALARGLRNFTTVFSVKTPGFHDISTKFLQNQLGIASNCRVQSLMIILRILNASSSRFDCQRHFHVVAPTQGIPLNTISFNQKPHTKPHLALIAACKKNLNWFSYLEFHKSYDMSMGISVYCSSVLCYTKYKSHLINLLCYRL